MVDGTLQVGVGGVLLEVQGRGQMVQAVHDLGGKSRDVFQVLPKILLIFFGDFLSHWHLLQIRQSARHQDHTHGLFIFNIVRPPPLRPDQLGRNTPNNPGTKSNVHRNRPGAAPADIPDQNLSATNGREQPAHPGDPRDGRVHETPRAAGRNEDEDVQFRRVQVLRQLLQRAQSGNGAVAAAPG